MRKTFLALLALLFSAVCPPIFGQDSHDMPHATIIGRVRADGEPISGAVLRQSGTTIMAISDSEGYYRMENVHAGTCVLECSLLGYKTQRRTLEIPSGESVEVNFDLVSDFLAVDQVVVTGDRRSLTRREAPVVIGTVSPQLMKSISSISLGDGLNFLSGLRMENNCQNCGFNQVRMNGLPGEYSQILINGRPIFGSVLGVYGMEMLPSGMVKSVEVLRGGGSSLYGSSAVAGTVNLILKEPVDNLFEATLQGGAVGVGVKGSTGVKHDFSSSFNGSVVTHDARAGMAIWGSVRDRAPWDANGDTISELAQLRMGNVGLNAYHRIGHRGNLNATYFYIYEKRRGGDHFDRPRHGASVAEAPNHSVHNLSMAYKQMLREQDQLEVSVAFQHLNRDAYYGGSSLRDYGLTKNWTVNSGITYTAHLPWNASITSGADFSTEYLHDQKCAYWDKDDPTWLQNHLNEINGGISEQEWEHGDPPFLPATVIADQRMYTGGLFLQYNQKFSVGSATIGMRYDHFQVHNLDKEAMGNTKNYTGHVPVPRVTLLFNLLPDLQLRANYAMGYRAPVVYNEELHVESSAARRVRILNGDGLKPEYSHSAVLSLDYNQQFDSWAIGVLAEGFYTRLLNAFISDRAEPDAQGTVILTRRNFAPGAHVYGGNLEFNAVPTRSLTLKLGATLQKSEYLKAVEDFNEGEKGFLRSPSTYGYLVGQWNVWKGLTLDASLSVTGPMKIHYEYAEEEGQRVSAEEQALFDTGEPIIRSTQWFADLGLKVSYKIPLQRTALNIFVGAKNLANSFQKDFDLGPGRASSYTYGPMYPRTLYMGITFGNIF